MARSAPPSSKRRIWWIPVAILAALVLVSGTWLAAARFQSSAQRQAAAEPPPAEPILMEITRTDLVEQSTMTATAAANDLRSFPLPEPSAVSVITGEGVGAGQTLESGALVAWINDRPVIALKGEFPLFRDIGVGDHGEDVRMIQRALADLGYSITADGAFGTWTAATVEELFAKNGAEASTRPKTVGEQSTADSAQSGEVSRALPKKPQTEVVLKASELLIIPNLPGKVSKIPAVGTRLGEGGSALELSGTGATLTSEVPANVGARMTSGTGGSAQLGDISIPVRISAVAAPESASPDQAGQEAMAGSGTAIVHLEPTDGAIPSEWIGKPGILVSIDLSQPLHDVLVIPQRAIASDARGSASVLIQDGNEFRQVEVEQLRCIAGMCAIRDGAGSQGPREGQLVRVDRQ